MSVEDSIVNAIMEVPVAMVKREGYCPKWVTAFSLTAEQGDELQRIKSGLIGCGATLNSGRAVESTTSVIQWLLEAVARTRTEQSGN